MHLKAHRVNPHLRDRTACAGTRVQLRKDEPVTPVGGSSQAL